VVGGKNNRAGELASANPDDESARCRALRAEDQPQRFLSTPPPAIYNTFNVQRHLTSAVRRNRGFRAAAIDTWRGGGRLRTYDMQPRRHAAFFAFLVQQRDKAPTENLPPLAVNDITDCPTMRPCQTSRTRLPLFLRAPHPAHSRPLAPRACRLVAIRPIFVAGRHDLGIGVRDMAGRPWNRIGLACSPWKMARQRKRIRPFIGRG